MLFLPFSILLVSPEYSGINIPHIFFYKILMKNISRIYYREVLSLELLPSC